MLWGEKRMFIGHFAPALLAAAVTPQRPRLGMYFIAAQLVDWAFFALLLLGVENMRVVPGITAMNPMDLYHMPYTHSLVGSACFAIGFAAIVWLATRERRVSLLADWWCCRTGRSICWSIAPT